MKNIKTFKKTSSRIISFVLAIMVFVSSLPYFPLTADALTPTNPSNTTQTGFNTVGNFETAKWQEITKAVFGDATYISTPPNNYDDFTIADNQYFKWHTFTESDGVTAWDGKTTEVTSQQETITYVGDSVVGGDVTNSNGTAKTPTTYTQDNFSVTYTVYNVSNASELRYAMTKAEEQQKTQNTKINITNDINLSGDNNQKWLPNMYNNMGSNWLYIEGNGHTIYNMRCHNTQTSGNYGNGGFAGNFNCSNGKLIMKNLNFSNCMSFSDSKTSATEKAVSRSSTAVAIGYIACRAYIENVNIYDSFIYSKTALTGTLIGRTETFGGNVFIRNCSSQNCYIYGTDHSGGLTGCQHNRGSDYKVKYNAAFPSSPEAWLEYGKSVYPEMVENSYSVDCTVFSTGSDSGAFLSCGGKLICRNCFTNNTMYGNSKTGAFFGRVVTIDGGNNPLYDDKGKKTVDIYFENCYASGSVEGQDMIGGFVGYENARNDASYGVSVYKNCYTTAMVGMDYAGKQLGGFIGYESTYPVQKAVIKDENGNQINVDKNGNTKPGSVYINCYAAGEVGNIQTDTSTTATGNYLGGFTGYTNETNGTYVNCYYDMQTTGMRERACGKADQFYTADFSAVDSAVNSKSALTETQKDNLIKLRNDYIYHTENNVDANYNIDLTPIDNALDLITDQQKNALLELKKQILSQNSAADVSAINDVLGIVKYTGSQKSEKLNVLKSTISQILSDEELTIPDSSIIDTIRNKYNLTTKLDTIPDTTITISDDMTSLRILRDKVQKLVDNKFYPSTVGISTLKDIYGEITTDEVKYLKNFQSTLNIKILNDDTKASTINDTIANATDEKIYKKYTLDEMCKALDDVINSVNTYISYDQNAKLIALREVLKDSGFWISSIFTDSNAFSSIARVTELLTQDKQDRLKTVKDNLTSKYHNIDTSIIDSIKNNTGLLTDAQKVKLITLKSELSYYLDGKISADVLSIIDDLLYSISNDEKNALLSLKTTYPDIDTSIIDEVVTLNGFTDDEKKALSAMKSESLPYASQIPGVTGVYTQESVKKGVEGLADSVNMGDTNAWQNDQQDDMYPALKVFYDESTINSHFGTMNISGQKVTTQTITDEEGNTTEEKVLSPLYDDDTKTRIESQLNEKTDIVKKYARASVSTVLLSHWDNTMNMNTGTLGDENNWKPGLPANRLTQVDYKTTDPYKWKLDRDDKCWEITYNNLAAGTYEFKVQQGTAWAYNFGKNKFNGDNCVLDVKQDCNVKIKFDYIPNVSESGVNTNFQIWAEYYNKDGTLIGYDLLGENQNSIAKDIWTAVGSFSVTDKKPGGWDETDDKYDLHYVDGGLYVGYFDFEPGDYEFKIVKDHDWAECYGKSSISDSEGGNMSFTVTGSCKVRVAFDTNTKVTTLTSTPADALENVQTVEEINFQGYSLIGSKTITGHEWFDGQQSLETGKMDSRDDGISYTKTFTITKDNFNNTYGYKVIKDGLDTGLRQYYSITAPVDSTIDSVDITFIYYPSSNKTDISTSDNTVQISTPNEPEYYGVLGSTALTGLNWGKDSSDNDVPAAGKMTPNIHNPNIWTKTFEGVPAGTHKFKVVAESNWNFGIDYGSSNGNNYKFTTTEKADITIKFDSTTKKITVVSDPKDAIFVDSYVVCGNENLTGENKNTASTINKMTYDKSTGLYSKTYTNLYSDLQKNYTFKIVKYSQNNDNDYEAFTIYSDDPDDTEPYKLVITYDPNLKRTEYKLYNSSGNDVTEYIREPYIEYYCVAGDQNLTGYNWLDESTYTDAVKKGKMELDATTGIWSVTFPGVVVEPNIRSLAFKIAANGTWSSGIDYGQKNGDNYVITLASDTHNKCDVTIAFNEETHEINVSTTPDCMATIDESRFDWFVCGTYLLVSEDAYKAPATIYDTVRDITTDFTFTSDSDVNWSKNESKNDESGFFDHIGTTEGGTGFNLNYTVEGQTVQGTFNEQVITLDSKDKTDSSSNTYKEYSCTNFMPGKQWLEVQTGTETDTVKGTRNLRLIPTAYLEAGNDAVVRVFQSESDTKKTDVNNIVTYDENSISGVTFTGLKDNDNKDKVFDRYNFALTAAYAITDITGLGCYGNYNVQSVVPYAENQIRKNILDKTKATTYFMMTSAFTKSGSYYDTTNLVVDELEDMSLIGSSYNDGENFAKKIVKIYKEVEIKDDHGKVVSTTEQKVFMDSSDTSTTEYHTNYLKWTGQQAFDSNDEGTYNVTYFWSLSDGRYLKDSKKVYIKSNVSDITKTVDKPYIEKNENANDKNLTYTITYTNRCIGDYTILDVLPFNNDVRYSDYKGNVTNSFMDNSSFTLKSVTVKTEFTPEDTTQPTVTNENDSSVRRYYWSNAYGKSIVQGYIKDNDSPTSDAASKVNVTDTINWTEYSGGNVGNLTALVFTGSQTFPGESVVTITYEVTVNDPAFQDYYVNNAYFYVMDTLSGKNYDINGFGIPAYTSVVGRCLSGYVWYDSNLNGTFDSNEPAIQGVTVKLMQKQSDNSYSQVASTTTDSEGSYTFDDIYPASKYNTSARSDDTPSNTKAEYNEDDYRVEFSAVQNENGQRNVIIKYSALGSEKQDETIDFDNKLKLSRRFSSYQVTKKSDSKNIAQYVNAGATENKQYYINEVLPQADDIIANNNQQRYNGGSVSRGYFLKEYQNLGLQPIIEEQACSLTVKKIDNENGNIMPGVTFKLEYQPQDTTEYETLYVEEQTETTAISYKFVKQKIDAEGTPVVDTDGNPVYEYAYDKDNTPVQNKVIPADEIETDSGGLIKFTGLPSNVSYRLTEVSTLDGYNMLPNGVEFTLPYYIGKSLASGDTDITSDDGYVQASGEMDRAKGYYKNITYTITNSKIPNMPLTGVENNFSPIVLAFVLLSIGIVIFIAYKIYKAKKSA